METPLSLGYKMPAEWEKHSAVWLAWPKDITTFVQGIDLAEKTFCEIFKALENSEKIELIVSNESEQNRIQGMLKNFGVNLENINFHKVEYADVWTRDYAPIFLKKDVWTKWQYNVYGKSNEDPVYWAPLQKDNEVFNKISFPGTKFEAKIVMEGGSIEVNGKGTLITTEQCLLNPNRNPDLNKEQIENYLKDYLGVSKIIWLKKGLFNDHTDGHIDDIVKFVGSNKILCAYEEDPNDENYQTLKENYEVLQNSTDQDGKPFEIIKFPMPHMYYEDGHTVNSGSKASQNNDREKAAVSYINFYVGNNVLVAPVFNDPNDNKALEIIQSCFPERKVVGINCQNIIYGGGTIHCMTMQQPEI